MGGSGLKIKSKNSDNVSSQMKMKKKKKKVPRKDLKKRRRIERSVSSHSTGDLSDSDYTSSSSPTSLSGHKRKRTTKSKKHHRAKSSIPSEPDICHSTDFDSFSSDEKARKTKKGRKSRISLKSSKKRKPRKIYSSSDDGEYAKNVRKRKRAGKDSSLKSRKKLSKKKSLKKLSADSESYSTSPSSKSTDDDKISRKASRKRHKVRSSSFSSRSSGSDGEDRVGASKNDDSLALLGNNPRRLRSVICVPDRTFDELEKDVIKEEIVHDIDDYQSPKISYGDEEENNGEHDGHSQRESIEKFHAENYVTELTNPANDGEQIDKEHSARIRDFQKEMDSSASRGDLELTLRQKALENLMKFRGGHKRRLGPPENPENQTSGPTSNEEFLQPVEVEKPSPNNQKEHLKPEKITSDSDFLNASPKRDTIQGPETSRSSNASEERILGEQLPKDPSLEERRNESNNVPEFEEKTMMVMRGGEMVQVGYKVRIPNKTSRLGQRHLRR